MDVLELTRALWRKKWWIVAAVCITAVVTIVLLKYKKEEYKATAQISTGYTVRNAANLTEDELNQSQAEVRFNNLLALMNSPISFNLLSYRLLLHDLDSVEKRFRLRKGDADPNPIIEVSNALAAAEDNVMNFLSSKKESEIRIYSPENIKKVKRVVRHKLRNMLPLDTDDPDFELIHRFYDEFGYGFTNVRENIAIFRLGNTDYVQVDFTSENKDLSAYAANAFCQEFIRYYNSLMTKNTGESVELLKQKIQEKEKELDERMEILQTFKSSNNLHAELDGGTRATQLIDLENQRDEIRSRIHGLELTISRLKDELNASGSSSSNSSNIRIVDLQNKINDLNSQYIAQGGNDAGLQDSLSTLRHELRLLVGSIETTRPRVPRSEIRSQIRDAEINHQVELNRLAVVNAKIQDLNINFVGYSSKEARLASLQKEIDMVSEEHLDLVNRYNLAKNNLTSSTIRQARIATPPLQPVSMEKIILLALACAASMLLAVFGIVLTEVLNFSIKTPSRFQRMVNIPYLGSLNKVDTDSFNIHKQFMSKGPTSRGEINRSLLRQMRYELESLNSKVFLFTSLKAKEGKTFAIFCAAYILSLLNKRVLVIDTNFKNNSLTQLYGKDLKDIKVIQKMVPSKLLSEKAESEPQPEDPQVNKPIYKLVNPTKYKNVFFIGNIGIANSSPSEILSSKDFKSFIEIMKERYDYILLEGASLNEHSDTKELQEYVDKVVAVVSAETVIEPIDEKSIRYLKTLDGRLAGGILNKVDHKDLRL